MKRETHPFCAFSFVARTDLRPRLRGPRARAPAGRDVSASRPQSSPLPAPSLLIQTTIRRVHVGVTASYLRSIRFVRHRSRSTIQCRRTVLATPVTRRLLGFQKNPSKRSNCSPNFKLLVESIALHDDSFTTFVCVEMFLPVSSSDRLLSA